MGQRRAPRARPARRSRARAGRRPRGRAPPRSGWRRARRRSSAAAARPPGRSLIRTNRISRRPAFVSCRRISPGSTPRSTLPPLSTTHVVPTRAGLTRPESSAATPTAPAPSTKSLARSISSTMASATASSSTTTMSSSHSSISGRVISPGRFTAMPSARVTTGPCARRLVGVRRAGRGLHADHLDRRVVALRARWPRRWPDRRHRAGRSAGAGRRCRRSARAERGLAGDTARSSYGWQNSMPASVGPLAAPRAPPRRASRRPRRRWPRSSRQASILEIGAPAGTKISQRTPAWRAANASAWAWLPALPAVTPLRPPAAERGELAHRPADLEAAGALQVLRLQHDPSADAVADRRRRGDRGVLDHAAAGVPRAASMSTGRAAAPTCGHVR